MVDIFIVDTDTESRSWDTSVLRDTEIKRAESMVQPVKRRRWIRSRVAVRELLSERTGISPGELIFGNEPGKPIVSNEHDDLPSFSISHSKNFTCVAVCMDCEVGIDIEEHRTVRNRELKTGKFFCPCEQEALNAMDEQKRAKAFLQTWTAKEAWLKAIGCGVVSFPVTQVCVDVQPTLRYRHTQDHSPDNWNLTPIHIDGFIGAVACRRGNSVHFRSTGL